MIWTLALRNVAREARRTIAAVLALALGAFFIVVGGGLVAGLEAGLTRQVRDVLVGDLQVFARGAPALDVLDEMPADLPLLEDPARLVRVLAADPQVRSVTPRLGVSGLLSTTGRSAPATVFGIDPRGEPGLPDMPALPPHSIVLGRGLLRRLGVGPKGEVTFLAPQPDGLFEGGVFAAAESAALSDPLLAGEFVAFAPLEDIRDLLGVGSVASSVVVRLERGADVDRARSRLEQRLREAGLPASIRTWREQAGAVADIGRVGGIGLAVGSALLLATVALGLVDAVLLLVLDRRREIGAMRALGAPRVRVVAALLVEMGLVSSLGGAAGALAGALVCAALGHTGIPAPTRAMAFAFGGARLYPVADLPAIVVGFASVAALGPLAAFVPALSASRRDPARSLRTT